MVATVYWRKFPSTDRLGSRMWTISSLLGCAAMPVRSGPTLPPSPECVWHLAHSFLKTSLPREASPPFRTIGESAWMTFSRSGSGRPPPLASSALARSAIALSGWAASACDCESVRSDIGTLPASIPPTSAFVQSVLPSSARTLAFRAAGVIGPIASTSAVPTSGASLVAAAAIRPLARSGGVFAVTRAITSRAACGSALRRSMSCRAASMRAASVAFSSEADARRSFASAATNASSPSTPQREARPSIWPREPAESFGRRAASAVWPCRRRASGPCPSASPWRGRR